MAKIIINQKICDRSSECGGIAVCPNHALSFDEKTKSVIWDKDKCTFCLKCTLPDNCPIGAIMFAHDDATEKTILDAINSDPRTEEWLMQERFGVQPGNPAIAKILDDSNFSTLLDSNETALIDIWHDKYSTCRLYSVPYQDFLKEFDNINIYKLDANKFPKLAEKLQSTSPVSLVLLVNNKIYQIHSGSFEESELGDIITSIKKIINLI